MADYRTEEEQIELLKKWWNENGKSTVAGIVLALAGYAGWMGWHSHQQAQMAAAANSFQELLVAAESPDKASVVQVLGAQLQKDHPGTVYSVLASLQLARDAVRAGDLAKAAEWLVQAQQQKPDDSLVPVIALRLAQVQYAQGELDKALFTLAQAKAGESWQVSFGELKGDILLAQGKREEARASYSTALQALDNTAAQDRRADIEMKLADLAVAAAAGGHP